MNCHVVAIDPLSGLPLLSSFGLGQSEIYCERTERSAIMKAANTKGTPREIELSKQRNTIIEATQRQGLVCGVI